MSYKEQSQAPPVAPLVTSEMIVKPVVDKDIYLSVRVLQSKATQAILDINKLGLQLRLWTWRKAYTKTL